MQIKVGKDLKYGQLNLDGGSSTLAHQKSDVIHDLWVASKFKGPGLDMARPSIRWGSPEGLTEHGLQMSLYYARTSL